MLPDITYPPLQADGRTSDRWPALCVSPFPIYKSDKRKHNLKQ